MTEEEQGKRVLRSENCKQIYKEEQEKENDME